MATLRLRLIVLVMFLSLPSFFSMIYAAVGDSVNAYPVSDKEFG